MRLRAGFPDIEAVCCTLLEDLAPSYTRVPEYGPSAFFLVRRITGGNDEFTDYPVVEVQAIALATPDQNNPRDVAFHLGEDARQVILASRRTRVGGVTVDDALNVTPPAEHPDENPDIRRVVGTYEFSMRRPFRP